MIELPIRDPCDLCLAVRDERWKILEENEHKLASAALSHADMLRCCSIFPTGSARPYWQRPRELQRRSSRPTGPSEYSRFRTTGSIVDKKLRTFISMLCLGREAVIGA